MFAVGFAVSPSQKCRSRTIISHSSRCMSGDAGEPPVFPVVKFGDALSRSRCRYLLLLLLLPLLLLIMMTMHLFADANLTGRQKKKNYWCFSTELHPTLFGGGGRKIYGMHFCVCYVTGLCYCCCYRTCVALLPYGRVHTLSDRLHTTLVACNFSCLYCGKLWQRHPPEK